MDLPSTRARIAVAAALLALAGWVAVYFATVWEDGLVGLPELREQGVVYLEDRETFLVADGSEVLALSARSPGRDGRLLYCESLQTFHGPHGEGFNLRGEYFAGPAPRDMDRYEVEVSGDVVNVDFSERVVASGRASRLSRPVDPGGRLCSPREGQPGFALPSG